jgi:hypothetical protein
LIVIAPETTTSSPERRTSSEAKLRRGWRSASKNSGDWRCASRLGSLTSTLATSAEPASTPSTRVASNRENEPRKVPAM